LLINELIVFIFIILFVSQAYKLSNPLKFPGFIWPCEFWKHEYERTKKKEVE